MYLFIFDNVTVIIIDYTDGPGFVRTGGGGAY